ncbi:MAG: hypothetical protein VB084_06105 [Syntrophomonadaceae bacterium]|nr:hypothetical protein [Syntrophomonadaceae bacterium]
MSAHLEKIKEEIIALQPVYTDIGNATRLILPEGESLDSRGMRSVIMALARIYAVDLAAQRDSLELRLNRHGVMPFYLSKERIFVPLKMRKALAPKDMVYGYVDVRFMGEVAASGDRTCMVPLPGSRQIEIVSKRSTVLQCQHMGQRLLKILNSEKSSDPGEKILTDVSIYLHRTIKGIERRLENIEVAIIDHEAREEK